MVLSDMIGLSQTLTHSCLLDELVFWMVKYEFPEKVVTFLLSLLPDDHYKVCLCFTELGQMSPKPSSSCLWLLYCNMMELDYYYKQHTAFVKHYSRISVVRNKGLKRGILPIVWSTSVLCIIYSLFTGSFHSGLCKTLQSYFARTSQRPEEGDDRQSCGPHQYSVLYIHYLQEAFTRAFVKHYSRISLVLVKGLKRAMIANRVVHISVQLFSNETLACQMVEEFNLLYTLIISLNHMVESTLMESSLQGI